jgi:phosphoribosylformylglycinamidine cyclo-ligase
VHAAAHVTGGGLTANLARALPDRIGARIDMSTWERPSVFDLIAERGVTETELRRAFNLGIGFCLVVDEQMTDAVIEATGQHAPRVIGHAIPGEGVLVD